MRVTIHIDRYLEHHREWGDIFAAGLAVHGITARFETGYLPTECDLAVLWSHHPRGAAVMAMQLSRGLDCLIMERGCLGDVFENTSLGFCGQDGKVDYRNEDSPGDRWEATYAGLMQPWTKRRKGNVLLCGHVSNDRAVEHVNIRAWYVNAVREIRGLTKSPVVFRPHPKADKEESGPPGATVSEGTLEEDLAKARVVVTFNSTVGMDAILAGVPTITADEKNASLAWPMAAHEISAVNSPVRPDRSQWAHNLAYTQWSREEIRSGLAWKHLRLKIA